MEVRAGAEVAHSGRHFGKVSTATGGNRVRQSTAAAGTFASRSGRQLWPPTEEERDMPEPNDWNEKIIAEFRASEGRVGGPFQGAPMLLVHHRGRRSGRAYVNPMMYLPDDGDDDTIYVFATKSGAPSNPDWYYNLAAAGEATVERGTDTYRVTVRELGGDERDSVYDEQARRYPGFADYARRTAGIRTIPVLELRRS
jgi:deazaflavin-dependent oxidoreductase (nitroreductase family)